VQTFGGSGSAVDPFWIQTVNDSGSMALTTRLSYVIGANYVRTDISTTNKGTQERTVELAGYGDCYIAGDDMGYSNVVAGTAAECHAEKVGGAVVTLLAATPGAAVVAGNVQPIYAAVREQRFITGSSMANTCVPNACMSVREDNAGALAWERTVAPGETFAVSYLNAYTDADNPPFSNLVVDSSVSKTQAALGDEVRYSLSVRNDGPADADNVDLSFPIPAGMTFLDADQAGYDASTGSWAVGHLPSGSTKTITLRTQAAQVGAVTAQILSATSTNIDPSPCVTGSSANCGPSLSLNVVAVPAASTSTIGVSPSSIPADGSTTSTVTISLRDVNGDPIVVGGDKVTLNTNLGVLGAVTDHGDGTYSAPLSGVAAGTATVTFTVNGADATNTADVSLVAVPAASTSTIGVSPSSIPADGSTTSTVTVTVRDLNGDPIVVGGDKVTLNTNLGVLGAVTDHGDGTYSASLSGAAAGTATVTFTVNGADATNTADVTLVAVPAASAPPVEPAPPVESAPPVEAGLASTGINIETGLAYVGLLLGAGLLLALAKWKRRTNAS
jgi:uncharacterized repeat protein (TIGR01451 family)